MFVPSFFPLSGGRLNKQENVSKRHDGCDCADQIRLFEEFLQKKLADFRKLESFKPEANEIEITVDASEDTKAQETKSSDVKKEDSAAAKELVITIDSDAFKDETVPKDEKKLRMPRKKYNKSAPPRKA